MKPEWLRRKLPDPEAMNKMRSLLQRYGLNTVCQGALCPNQGECFSKGTATFLIMGNVCTRNCSFCNVHCGRPEPLDPEEPTRVAEAVRRLGLR